MKKILLLLSVLLTCWQINAQYCTTVIPTGCAAFSDTIDDFTIPVAGFSHLASGCSANNYGDFTSDSALQIDVAQTTPYDFTMTHGAGGQWVKIWIDFNADQVFDANEELFASLSGTVGTSPTIGSFTIPTSAQLGLTRMRVITIFGQVPSDPCTPMGTWGETHDYTVNILPPPSCPAPTNLTSVSVANTTADFSWDDVPSATAGYLWEVYNAGDDPAVDTAVSSGTFPAGSTSGQATGLLASSDYDFYLTSDCGATNGQSTTIGPVSFSTLCDVIIAPFTQDFNLAASIPNCWEQGATNGEPWLFGTGQTYTNIPPGTESPSGGNNAHIDDSTPDNLGTTLLSPLVDVSGLTTPALFFYWTSGDLGIYLPVDFRVDVWDGAAWNNVFERTSASGTLTNGFEEVIADLSTLTITGPVQVRFVVDEVEAGDFQDDIAIDDVKIDEAPTCLKPLNFTSLDVFFDSIEVSWSGVGNATSGYIWEVYAAGDDPAVDTPVSTGTFPAGTTQGIADGLMPEVDYDIYLASDCGAADGISEFTNAISFTTAPLCNVPSTFDVSNVLPDSAELAWTGIPNAAGYNWAVFNAGDDPATAMPAFSGVAPSTDTSVVVTGLTDNTSYDAYITTDCNPDGLSAQSSAVSFTTPCLPFVAPYFEDFTSASGTTPPACWAQGDANGEPWEFGPGETYTNIPPGTESFSGGNNAHIDDSTPDNLGTTLLTPLVDVSGLTTPALSFYWTSGDLGIYLPVDFRVDVWDGAAWNNVFERTSASGTITNGFEEVIADLSGLTITGPVQARFVVDEVEPGDFQDDLGIDDIKFDEAPTCLKPLGLAVSNETVDGVDISWNAITNATSGYIWSVFIAGDDPFMDTPVLTGTEAAGVTSTTITGLNSSTSYQVYIQSDCGPTDGLSDFSSPASFQTLCDVIPAPYFQDFANFAVTTTLVEDECWVEASPATFAWDVSTGTTPSTLTGPTGALFGPNYIFTEASTGAAGNEAIILTPFVDLSTLTTPALSFWYHMYGADIDVLHIDVDNGTTLDLSVDSIVGEQQTDNADPWEERIIDLSAYAGLTVQVRFRVVRGGSFDGDVALDGVRFDEAPTCFTPVNLSVTNITESAADFSWDDETTATDGYNWFVFNAGDDPDVDTPLANGSVAGGVTSVSVSGIPSSSDLQFYVQSDCGASGTSFLSVGLGFTTLCDVFIPDYLESFDTFLPNCWEEAGSGDPTTGPSEFGVSLYLHDDFLNTGGVNNSVNINLFAAGKEEWMISPIFDLSGGTYILQYLAAITDWQNSNPPELNGMGSDDEIQVLITDDNGLTWTPLTIYNQSSFPSETGDLEIFDLSAYTGDVRFAFWSSEGTVNDPEDYDFHFDEFEVKVAPPCLQPTGLSVGDVFFDSAEVSWLPNGNATGGYNWSVFNAGDDPAVDTPVSTGTFPAGSTQGLVDGLIPETDYDIYLQSSCGADGDSVLSIPVSVTTTPLCSVPSTFEVINLLPDSAELTWTAIPNAAGYNWAVFNAGDDPATATPVASGTAPSTDTSVVATGLTDNTSYDAYVTTDCGGDGLSVQSSAVTFLTPCTIFATPYFEDFETFTPSTSFDFAQCWTEVSPGAFDWNISNTDTPSFDTGPNQALSGTNFLYTEASSGVAGDEALFVSPLIDLSSLSDPALSFWYHMFGADMGTLNVDIDAGTGYDLAVFSLSGPQQTAQTDPWIEQFVDLSAYAGQTIQVRFRGERGSSFESDMSIDDVRVDEAPSCLTPTGLAVSNITANSVDISWSPVGNALTGYNWAVYAAGADPDVDIPLFNGSVGSGVTSTTISGLNPATVYNVYIQSNCGAIDGLSELSPGVFFQTLCATVPAPYFNNFENFTPTTTFVEQECWLEVSPGLFDWNVSNAGTPSTATGPDGAFSGTNFFYVEASSGALGDEALLESPSLDLTPLSVPALSFWYHMFGGDMGVLHVDVDPGTGYDLDVFTLAGEQQTSETEDWIQQFVDLSAYSGQSVVIRIRVERGNGFEGDVSIDDVRVDEAPTCFDPNSLEVLSVTDTSANLNWVAGSSETVFDVEVVLAGATPTGVPTFEDVTLPFTATGLTAETDYDFYVRADCGAGDVSNWVGPEGFTTVFTPTTVVVNAPAINNTYCYGNSEFKEWLFVSSDGVTPVEVQFNAGEIENDPDSTDRCRIFDGFDATAPVLYDTDIDGTDMAGVQLVANSGAAYILLESDIFESCQSGLINLVPLDFNVFAGTVSSVVFSETNFNFYPNPVRSILNIESANPIDSVQIFDILGKEVLNNNYNASTFNINLQELSSGTYLMKVNIGDSYNTYKIVKE